MSGKSGVTRPQGWFETLLWLGSIVFLVAAVVLLVLDMNERGFGAAVISFMLIQQVTNRRIVAAVERLDERHRTGRESKVRPWM